ncbi:unnamed protein product, partial [Meganyctiphanes norvegica]
PIPPLHEAIKQNQVEVVTNLLQQSDIDCNKIDIHGKSPLHYAAENNCTELCDLLLLQKGIKVDIVGRDSPLCHAIKNGHIDICEKLINSKVININFLNRKKRTAVHIAVESSKPEILKLLLSKGAKRNTKDHYNRTPLYYCLKYSDLDKKKCFLLLLEFEDQNDKVDVTTLDGNGDSALHWAIRDGSEFMVKRLLDLNANSNAQNKDGMTPVLDAAKRGSVKILKMLKEKNCNFEQLNNDNRGVLHIISLSKSQIGIHYLLENFDIDVIIKDKKGKTALHYAIEEYKPSFAHKLVIACSYCRTDDDFNNPIHIAAKKGMSSLVEQLTSQSRNAVDKQNKNNETPLHIAVKRDDANICRILVKKKAKFDIKDKDGKTALQLAVEKNCEQTVKEILNKAGERELSNTNNKTILHVAAQKGFLNCYKILIKKELNLCWLKDDDKKLPLEMAFMMRHAEVFCLLLKNMSSDGKIDEDIHIVQYFRTALEENI